MGILRCLGFPGGSDGEEPAVKETWVGKISWRREQQPTPVFLPGESHGQRSLVGYSPWGRKEPNMAEHLTLSLSFLDAERLSCLRSYS